MARPGRALRTAAAAVGWLFYVVVAVGAPPAAAFAGGYVADLVGGSRTTTMWAAAVIIAGVAALNWLGVRTSGRVQLGMAILLAERVRIQRILAQLGPAWGGTRRALNDLAKIIRR